MPFIIIGSSGSSSSSMSFLREFSRLTPEGRPGMFDVSPLSGISGLSFDSTLLSPLLFFCLVLLLVHSLELSQENPSNIFSLRDSFFVYCSCLAARRSKLVGGMCSMLPYGTGICCYAFIYKKIISSVHSFLTFLKFGID